MRILEELNAESVNSRLTSLKKIISQCDQKPKLNELNINNHVHTFYSFSPFSPTHAVYSAYMSGLGIVGIVDHDSVAGIREFHEAANILGIASTAGTEVRVKLPEFDRIINNPDQKGVMYLVAHGIPEASIDAFDDYLKPFRAQREIRNQKMIDKINCLLADSNIQIDYQQDVQSISKVAEGGTVTERHILMALSMKLLTHFKDIDTLIDFIEKTFSIKVTAKNKRFLNDPYNNMIVYDLLAALKSNTSKYYIPATDELPLADEYVAFVLSQGAIPAYAYLGDVEESVTGDKRAQKFEDSYLDELLVELKRIGIPAIAYMPTRNTSAQIERLQHLAKKYDMIEISGEDINSPRQSFSCDAYIDPQNNHLIDSAWALVGHEKLSAIAPDYGMLGSEYNHLSIEERIRFFSAHARKLRKENE